MDPATVFIVVTLGVIFYFLPTVFAAARGHHNSIALLLANLFLGWTFIGWVGCLIWAFTNKSKDTTVINNHNDKDELSVADELEKLLKLKESGVLSEEEFLFQKKKILS
jgi:hypothetical protein